VYLRSTDGLDADSGATWALADATLSASITAAGAGGRSFMSDNHAETTAAAITITSPGTAASKTAVICVDDAGNPEPPTALATTGTVSTTGSGSNISFTAHAAFYGHTYNISNAASAANWQAVNTGSQHLLYRSCAVKLVGTGAGSRIQIGSTGTINDALMEWNAVDVQTNNAGQAINPGYPLKWYGGSLLSGTQPTGGLFKLLAGTTSVVDVRGVDLSNLGSNALVAVGTATMGGAIDFCDMKMGASFTLATGTNPGPGMPTIRVMNSVASDVHVGWQESSYMGTVDHETTIVRTGGATWGGATYSHKLVASANAAFYTALWSPWYLIPVDVTGSLTLTVEFIHDSVTALHDGDIALELHAPTASGIPQHTITYNRRPILPTTTTNWGSSSVTWTTTGLTNPNKQKLTQTVTAAEVGTWKARVGLTQASKTVYIDPPKRAAVA
jgi:hypothetical protein